MSKRPHSKPAPKPAAASVPPIDEAVLGIIDDDSVMVSSKTAAILAQCQKATIEFEQMQENLQQLLDQFATIQARVASHAVQQKAEADALKRLDALVASIPSQASLTSPDPLVSPRLSPRASPRQSPRPSPRGVAETERRQRLLDKLTADSNQRRRWMSTGIVDDE